MKYLEPSFSTMAPPGKEYRDAWDRIFGKKTEAAAPVDPFEARIPEEEAPRPTIPDPMSSSAGATLSGDAMASQCIEALEEAEPCLKDLSERYCGATRYHRALASVRRALADAKAAGFR